MSVERKQYSADFKRDAVRMMTEGGQSAIQVAGILGINRNLRVCLRMPRCLRRG